MNRIRNAAAAASIVERMSRFDRFLARTVEHIYHSYAERAQMRLAPTRPFRRRIEIR